MRTHYRGRILIEAPLKVEEEEAGLLQFLPAIVRAGAHTHQGLWNSGVDLNRRLTEPSLRP